MPHIQDTSGSDPTDSFGASAWELSVEPMEEGLIELFIDWVGVDKWTDDYEPYTFGGSAWADGSGDTCLPLETFAGLGTASERTFATDLPSCWGWGSWAWCGHVAFRGHARREGRQPPGPR